MLHISIQRCIPLNTATYHKKNYREGTELKNIILTIKPPAMGKSKKLKTKARSLLLAALRLPDI
jgi:hypothetical protein